MMSAPSEMRSRFQPMAAITIATRASTSGTEAATTMPVRTPRKRKHTASTMASASRKVRSNSHTDSSTIRGWSATLSTTTPTGSAACRAAMRASSAWPSVRMLALRSNVTPSISTGWPLWRTVNCGGSSSPLRTSATSESLSRRPPASIGTSATSRASRSPLPFTERRTKTRSERPSALPEGPSAFCFASASISAWGPMPSAASRVLLNSTYTFSAWRPNTSTFVTPGTDCNPRLTSSTSTCSSGQLSSGAPSAYSTL